MCADALAFGGADRELGPAQRALVLLATTVCIGRRARRLVEVLTQFVDPLLSGRRGLVRGCRQALCVIERGGRVGECALGFDEILLGPAALLFARLPPSRRILA